MSKDRIRKEIIAISLILDGEFDLSNHTRVELDAIIKKVFRHREDDDLYEYLLALPLDRFSYDYIKILKTKIYEIDSDQIREKIRFISLYLDGEFCNRFSRMTRSELIAKLENLSFQKDIANSYKHLLTIPLIRFTTDYIKILEARLLKIQSNMRELMCS
jgi:hypothetical protein